MEKSEERSLIAQTKLAEASQAADESRRMCKVLENRSQQDEERMDQLTNQLKEARMLAEDADGKSDEVGFFKFPKCCLQIFRRFHGSWPSLKTNLR